MKEVYNFSAGPAMLPREVLMRAQEELIDWQGKGFSVMEMGHRTPEFSGIIKEIEQNFRELLSIPDGYKILFLSGGATSQFAMIPYNLLGNKNVADYINTGCWSKKAINEGKRYCQVNVVGENKKNETITLPSQAELELTSDAAYVHCTDNETIDGVEFNYIPNTDAIPLVTDMTSNILTRSFEVERYGLIYAGAQKNLGHAGVTAVIVKDDLLGEALPSTPTMFNYQNHADNHSCLNTPPSYAWYFVGLVLEWVKEQGGVEEMDKRSKRKSGKLYDFIDSRDFYINNVDVSCRSRLNVPFNLAKPDLTSKFLQESHDAGLINLKGHRSVGGMRASMYIGMPEDGVDRLIEFMKDFEKRS